ncbi:MAG: TlpA family protein disulfide reductase [Thermoanaerobaculia bacterium]
MLALAAVISLLAPGLASPEEGVLVGDLTREKIEAAHPDWVQAAVESQPKAEAARALAGVEPGAEVTVFLGTWCGDSRREVPRLWQSLDEAGGSVPFSIHYVGVDREKKEPAAGLAKNGVHYLPTFIVTRGGHEVGRIVETSPHGVETDLLALLTGKASGVLATRDDLAPPPPS